MRDESKHGGGKAEEWVSDKVKQKAFNEQVSIVTEM